MAAFDAQVKQLSVSLSHEYSCDADAVADAVADGARSSLEQRASTGEIGFFRYDFLIEVDEPLRKMQRFSVSNAVSSAKKLEHSPANLSGQKVLRFDEIWTSESTGEQEIWA